MASEEPSGEGEAQRLAPEAEPSNGAGVAQGSGDHESPTFPSEESSEPPHGEAPAENGVSTRGDAEQTTDDAPDSTSSGAPGGPEGERPKKKRKRRRKKKKEGAEAESKQPSEAPKADRPSKPHRH